MLLGYYSVMFTWSYWLMVLLSSSTSLLIFYPLFYQLLREKCWSLQQELWFVCFSFQLSFCLKNSIALLFDEYTFGVVNLGRLTLSLFYHLSLCLLLMGNKKSSDSPLGPLWNHPDGRKKEFHYYYGGRKSRPPTWPLWHHPSRGVDLLAPSGGHSRGNHGNNARESIHTRGSDQGMPSGDSSVLTKPFLWHVFVVLVNIASELNSPTSLVILWVAFHSLFLLKLAKSSFHWMQISILTDCTFHWLSAANPSGKQKPQPLPQTSLFLLRENNLESNL